MSLYLVYDLILTRVNFYLAFVESDFIVNTCIDLLE